MRRISPDSLPVGRKTIICISFRLALPRRGHASFIHEPITLLCTGGGRAGIAFPCQIVILILYRKGVPPKMSYNNSLSQNGMCHFGSTAPVLKICGIHSRPLPTDVPTTSGFGNYSGRWPLKIGGVLPLRTKGCSRTTVMI